MVMSAVLTYAILLFTEEAKLSHVMVCGLAFFHTSITL